MEEIRQETQIEQGTEEVSSQDGTTAVSPNPEELQKEIGRKEAVIQDIKRELRDSRKRSVPREEFDALQKSMEDANADMMDYLVDHLGEGEAEKPIRQTRRQQLEESRKTKPAPTPLAPNVQRFVSYIHSQGMSEDDPMVEEAVADDRSPEEALKYLKGKVDVQGQTAIEEKARILAEQILKDKGLTSGGADAPSAPSSKTFTRKGIDAMSIKEYAANKDSIAEAQRLGKIKD